MASLNLDYRRPCYIGVACDECIKAMFHCWSHESEITRHGSQVSTTFAIVEFENGFLGRVKPESIRFVDGGGFNEIAFPPSE